MQKTRQNSKPPKIVIPPAGAEFASINMEKGNGNSEKRRDSSHITPTKGNEMKKLKADEEEVSNVVLLQAISALTTRFDTQDSKMEVLMDQMRKNSVMMAEISKAVEFNAAEIKDCKRENAEMSKEITKLNKTDTELRNRMVELERYKRRWNLRINGLQEKSDEDPRREVCGLIGEIAPHLVHKLEEIIDSVHRVGKKEHGKQRQMIVQFTMRKYREEIWKATKNCSVCKDRGVRFVEDLTRQDRNARAALWPQIEKARKEGKKAYFRGPHVYIEGRQINVT